MQTGEESAALDQAYGRWSWISGLIMGAVVMGLMWGLAKGMG